MRIAPLASLLVLLGCPGSTVTEPVRQPGDWSEEELQTLRALRLDPTLPADPTNRWSDDPEAAKLGRSLFFDPGLSPSGAVSCATCHNPALGFSDGRAVSQGVGETARNAPAIPGSQYGPWQFWDGRADTLWAQAAGPVESPVEMGSDRTFFARHVMNTHGEAYRAIFGGGLTQEQLDRLPARAAPGIDPDLDAAWKALSAEDREAVMEVFTKGLKAIAAYERQLLPTEAPFDRYVDAVLAGDPEGGGHLKPAQVRGLSLFVREANCTLCHHGPHFTDRAFHNLGLPGLTRYDPGRSLGALEVLSHEFNCKSPWSDTDRCEELEYLDPSFPDFQQAFKTPTLRNVALTAPYMHHGGLQTLHEVIEFYDELPGESNVNHRELTLQPLGLTEKDRRDLVSFLNALTGDPLPDRLTSPPDPVDASSTPPTR
ncbi:MAG: hypothetical protein EA397_15295 [Deltaproteobacteria bacterium]|nr:MAG: hypothetical protein EA397_15295 [Deltaproteobacteria bacterium]